MKLKVNLTNMNELIKTIKNNEKSNITRKFNCKQ